MIKSIFIQSGFVLILLIISIPSLGAEAQKVPPSQMGPSGKKLTVAEKTELLALRISAGALVRVESYNKEKKTFKILIVDESAVGPNITTLPDLLKASGQPRTSRQMTNPESWVGREFKLVEDLRLIMP